MPSDNQKRQRLLQSTLHAITASENQILRRLIALDSTGNLSGLLRINDRYTDTLTVVD